MTLKGVNFAGGGARGVCRFGTALVPYAFVSTSEIVCVSPPVTSAATVTLEMATNLGHFTSSNLAFAVDPPPALHAVTPSDLLWTGRPSTITVSGAFFRAGAFVCVLGGTALPEAMVLSSRVATCLVPAHRPGVNATLHVSNDASSLSAQSLLISARAPPSGMPTLFPSLGSTSGGTTITIHAAGFEGEVAGLLIGGVACACEGIGEIGGIAGGAIAGGAPWCTCPPSEAGPARVALVLRGGALVPLEPFEYRQDPVVYGVTPSVASTTGGAILTIHGRELTSSFNLRGPDNLKGATKCVFSDGASGDTSGVATDASVVSSTRLLCASPAAAPGVSTRRPADPTP